MILQKFEDLTRRIWIDIKLSEKYGTIFDEETITDLILLDLAKQNYFNIRILQTPKPTEAIQGTDWEWYVGSYKYGWIRYVIQAKKMNAKTYKYDSLNHKVGQPPNADFQRNVLRTFANANGAVPLYNFYNCYPSAAQADHWQCDKTFDRELLGWTFTPLRNVDTAINTRGSRTFDKIHRFKETLPIRCLFTCPYFISLYKDQHTIGTTGDFLGEPFRKVKTLPQQFINAWETGVLGDFPEEFYDVQVKIYPKRIAIIELPDNDESIKTAFIEADKHNWSKDDLIAYDNVSIWEGDQRQEREKIIQKAEENKEAAMVIKLYLKEKSDEEIAYLLDLPIERVVGIVQRYLNRDK